jgi:hypothetical protein
MYRKTQFVYPPVESLSALNFFWEDELLKEKDQRGVKGQAIGSTKFTQREPESSIEKVNPKNGIHIQVKNMFTRIILYLHHKFTVYTLQYYSAH